MKKLIIALLLLVFVGVQSLAASGHEEEGDITLKVTPSVYGEGRVYIAGDEARAGKTPATHGDAEARAKFEADYKGIGGVKVEIEGEISTAKSNAKATHFGFGDNAYAYVHVLEAFGVDKKMFDAYLQSGRFNVDFDNAKEAGTDKWLADVDPLTRDEKVNMQLDLKIMDMVTIRWGTAFAQFDSKANALDMGWGLLFSNSFGDHKIDASLAYVVNLTENKGKNDDGTNKLVHKPTIKVGSKDEPWGADFDQFGFSLAYTGTFGTIKIMPFFNFRLKGVIHKPDNSSFVNPLFGWSAGLKFQLRDMDDGYDLVGAGIDMGGDTRSNLDYKNAAGTTVKVKNIENATFRGVGLKVWTDGLKAVMGKNYLHIWVKARLGLNDPGKPEGLEDIERKGFLDHFGIGLTQYLVNESNAKVKLLAEFNLNNIAPFYLKGVGYGNYKGNTVQKANTDFQIYFDLGLDASFTSIFKGM